MIATPGPTVSNRFDRRVATIHEHVSIFELLSRWGIDLTPETQQIRCPFHADASPSARVYAEQHVIYCFTCQQRWDVIACVQARFTLPFTAALDWLEEEFGLNGVTPSVSAEVRTILQRRPSPSVAQIAGELERQLWARRTALGYERYTRALLALDVTVYESQRLRPDVIVAQLRALLAAVQA